MIATTAKEAKTLGLKTYFTGKPCPKGHISERSVRNRGCLECDREITNAYCRRRYRENIDEERAYRRKHYEENKDAYKASASRQRGEGYQKIWWERNKGKWNALIAKRKADQSQRTPAWSEANAIEQFYKNCPTGMTVDHIIPLRGKAVSGLHVLANLQYLTKSENSKKNNTFNPEIYPEQLC